MKLDFQSHIQRFTARTRVYTLAILGVAVGAVYLSIAVFLELSGRIGAVYAALVTGVLVILVGAIPWLSMSFGRLDPPSAAPGGSSGSDSSSQEDSKDPLLRAELLGENASEQVSEAIRKNALLSIGVAAAAGLVVGSSPRARRTVANLLDSLLEEQSRRR